jgi:hypothetical protein
MLPADQLELLTAAVDGELTPARARQFRRLLDRSAEARTVYARLKADSDRLRNLPTVPAPADLRDRVLAALPVTVPAPPAAPARRPAPRWVPVAIAACLLLGVAASSFWFFTRDDPAERGAASARAGDRPRPGPTTPPDPDWKAILPAETPSAPTQPLPEKSSVARTEVPSPRPAAPDILPFPRSVERNIAGFPPLPEIAPLDLVQVRVPFLLPASDLEREDIRQRLVGELAREPAFRLDVFAKDPARAAERLQTAATRGLGMTVHTDAGAATLIKRRQPAGFVFYTESLAPAEVHDLLARAARAARADAKAAEPVFDLIHATPAQPADQRELRDVLGFDPGPWKKPAAADPKPVGKPGGVAVLMTHSPANFRTVPGTSKELKQYQEKRGDRKPTAVPVMIVVRPVG